MRDFISIVVRPKVLKTCPLKINGNLFCKLLCTFVKDQRKMQYGDTTVIIYECSRTKTKTVLRLQNWVFGKNMLSLG